MKTPTRCARLPGIDTPIIQAPMAGGTTMPELVSAVSNAGGLGSIGAGYLMPDYPIQNAWTKDVRAAASKHERTEFMSLWAGQGASLGRRTTAGQLIADIRRDLSRVAID